MLLAAAEKIHFKEQAQVAGTKQSRQANKAARLARQSGLPALFWACLVGLVTATNAHFTKWIFTIDIKSLQNRLLKVCYVPTTSASLPRLLFLLRPLTVLMKQTRQAVCAI